MSKILMVDDDAMLADKTKQWLEDIDKHIVEWASNAEDGLQLVGQFAYDLLILDWQLPGMSGIELCEAVRRKGVSTPILFLTGMTDIENVELGLTKGADDYLKKPFQLRELSARCKALLRRPAQMNAIDSKSRNVSLEPDKRLLTINAVSVSLTKLESALMQHLMRHPGQSFSASDVLRFVYPSNKESSEEAVRVLVKGLRAKLEQCGDSTAGTLLKTTPGAGYSFESPE